MTSAAIFALMLSISAAPAARLDVLSGFQCGTAQAAARAPEDILEPAYIQRSAAIIRAALANDTSLLKRFVARGATAALFHYDNGIPSPSTGPKAVVWLVRSIAPRHYEFFEPRGMPVPARNPCGTITISLIVKSANADEAHLATFRYEHGLLVELIVNDADYTAGEFGNPSR